MNLLPLLFSFTSLFSAPAPDSVYLLSYAVPQNEGRSGLQFAWSGNQQTWQTIGNDFGFVKCDYGRWGSEKKMIDPFLFRDALGTWHCFWSVNLKDNLFAHAASTNLVDWGRQSYNYTPANTTCLELSAYKSSTSPAYTIQFFNPGTNEFLETLTTDFKSYKPAQTSKKIKSSHRNNYLIGNTSVHGQVHKVPWSVVEQMIAAYERTQYQNALYKESTAQDPQRFASLKPFEIKVKAKPENKLAISSLLTGIFFEDINYAADGGLYGELLQNRDFEYQASDKSGRDSSWKASHSWSFSGNPSSFKIETSLPLHPNNIHYAHIDFLKQKEVLSNLGFDLINIQNKEAYNFSLFTRLPKGSKGGKIKIRLVSPTAGLLAEGILKADARTWKENKIRLLATSSATDAHLEIEPDFKGPLDIDMASLFPENTFKGRKNGLRADLAQSIANIHPRFIRFPGGCVAHGDGLANIYRWKNTIGPLYSRKQDRNIWGYHQSVGLGYFEYLQFCEDIGAEPLPVLAAGVPCQNSGTGGGGQQGGIPMKEMDEYVQDILDLIEYCNGDENTKWGKIRAEAGHPKPFHLKFIGIGNEDLITDVFEERFTMIFNAVKEKHPEITVIGTVGPFYQGTDYREGWELANKLGVPMVDEHYYQPPAWFIQNQDFYDSYDRKKSKVYLGEYAAHLPGRPNNLETALSEALYLNALEKNGDIVSMASYAPLLAKEGHTQWNPNLIYFNNTEVKTTVGYEVQKLYGNNAGDAYIPMDLELDNTQEAVRKRVSLSMTFDSQTGDYIVKLVNLLPVATTINFVTGINFTNKNYIKTTLQGSPADKKILPVVTEGTWNKEQKLEMGPYSFNVLRIKK